MTSGWKRPRPCQGGTVPPVFLVLTWKLLQCPEEGTAFPGTPLVQSLPHSSQAGGPWAVQ